LIGIWVLGIWGFRPVSADIIHTLDGKTYDGEIRLEGGQSIHIVDKDGRNSAVKLSHLLDASFDASPVSAMSRGVVLTDGTVLAGSVDNIGDKTVQVTPPECASLSVPVGRVARILFQSAPSELIDKAPAGASGLLLKGGDFFEGQIRGFNGRNIRIESALLGVAEFDTQDKAVALIFRPAKPLDGEIIIRTTNGGELAADHLSLDHGQLKFNAIGIGPMALPRKDLASIHTGGGRLIPLTELRPDAVEGDPATGYQIDSTNIGLRPRLFGVDLKHAVSVATGTTVTFSLDEKYDVFTAKVGPPADAVPMVQLRFAVIVDGKESATATQSAVDDPAAFSVDIRHAKKLTLVVTASSSAGSGLCGIWGDPQLVRHASQSLPASTAR
jgi:hypothetical protein